MLTPRQAKVHNERLSGELKTAEQALDQVNQPTSFIVASQREKAAEISRLKNTINIQNKKIIEMEETIDRLRQVSIFIALNYL